VDLVGLGAPLLPLGAPLFSLDALLHALIVEKLALHTTFSRRKRFRRVIGG
jgi:hypothetical protein